MEEGNGFFYLPSYPLLDAVIVCKLQQSKLRRWGRWERGNFCSKVDPQWATERLTQALDLSEYCCACIILVCASCVTLLCGPLQPCREPGCWGVKCLHNEWLYVVHAAIDTKPPRPCQFPKVLDFMLFFMSRRFICVAAALPLHVVCI